MCPSIVIPITFLNKSYLHLQVGSNLRVSSPHVAGGCFASSACARGTSFSPLSSKWFGEVGTQALPLTSGMGINSNLANQSPFLSSGLGDCGVKLGTWPQGSQSEHHLGQWLGL